MHPINGYLLAQLNLKPKDLAEVTKFLSLVNQHLEAIGFGSLPVEDLDQNLIKVNIGDLRTIADLRPLMIELSLIHPKVELSTEYKQLQTLIEKKVAEYLNKADDIVAKLDKDFKNKYKQALDDFSRKAVDLSYTLDKKDKEKHQAKLEQYLSFSEFKPLIEQLIGEQVSLATVLSYDQNYDNTLVQLFTTMKHKVMAAKANIPSLVDKFGLEIPVNEIKDSDPVAFEYLRAKAFEQAAMDYFQLSIPLDKTYDQRIIRPSDPLAQKLKLTAAQMAIFALSVDPIRDFGLAKGQRMESSQNPHLKFLVLNDQHQMKMDQKIKVQVNEDTFIHVVTPIYVSYVKAELVKSQQSSSIRTV